MLDTPEQERIIRAFLNREISMDEAARQYADAAPPQRITLRDRIAHRLSNLVLDTIATPWYRAMIRDSIAIGIEEAARRANGPRDLRMDSARRVVRVAAGLDGSDDGR